MSGTLCEEKGNPVMIFPTKKRINTELFIDKTAALYKGISQIRDKTANRLCIQKESRQGNLYAKKCGNERLSINLII